MEAHFSFWEADYYGQLYDVIVIGAGFVGISAAMEIKRLSPALRILVLEKGNLSQGASSKNAGFSCFGSVGELEDDLAHQHLDKVLETVEMRWKGLQKLKHAVPVSSMNYEAINSYEMFRSKELFESAAARVDFWNNALKEIIGKDVFKPKSLLITSLYSQAIFNPYEGQLNPKRTIEYLHSDAQKKGVEILKGIEITNWSTNGNFISVNSDQHITFRSRKILFATNGFTKKLIEKLDVRPARNQVLITKPIKHLKLLGNFHLDRGYIYFRNVGDRLLLGGARYISDKEETSEYGQTEIIQKYLTELLTEKLLPNEKVEIERWWSGILGIGVEKMPIIQEIENHVYVAVRLGGMGVAIGLETGEKAAQLLTKSL